jgi:hypothetical protein
LALIFAMQLLSFTVAASTDMGFCIMRVGAALNLCSCLGMTEKNWICLATGTESQHPNEKDKTHRRSSMVVNRTHAGVSIGPAHLLSNHASSWLCSPVSQSRPQGEPTNCEEGKSSSYGRTGATLRAMRIYERHRAGLKAMWPLYLPSRTLLFYAEFDENTDNLQLSTEWCVYNFLI